MIQRTRTEDLLDKKEKAEEDKERTVRTKVKRKKNYRRVKMDEGNNNYIPLRDSTCPFPFSFVFFLCEFHNELSFT